MWPSSVDQPPSIERRRSCLWPRLSPGCSKCGRRRWCPSGQLLQGVEPALEFGAADSDLAVGQLDAAGGATLGAPLVEGRAGDAQLLAELRDSQAVLRACHGDYSSRSGE